MRFPSPLAAPVLALTGLLAPSAAAQCVETEAQKIVPVGGTDGDFFGAVALDGVHALIGGWGDDFNGDDAGQVQAFRLVDGAWTFVNDLTPTDAFPGDRFGTSVAVHGDVAVIGAPFVANAEGAAYVFRFDGQIWQEEQRLLPSTPASGAVFGSAVAVHGDVVLVGSSENFFFGAVYSYRFDGLAWNEEQKLVGDGGEAELFGYDIDIDGDVVVIGAPFDSPTNYGAAFVFRHDGLAWNLDQKLVAGDAADYEELGLSVSIDGDRIAAGAMGNGAQTDNPGKVVVFEDAGAGFVEQAVLIPNEGNPIGRFGVVALDGDQLAVGARLGDETGPQSGEAYLYRYDPNGGQWHESHKLAASDGEADDQLGSSVAISGSRALVGARVAEGAHGESGAAYWFDVDIKVGAVTSTEVQEVPSPNTSPDSSFFYVDVDGDVAAIGEGGAEVVHVMRRTGSTWEFETELVGSDSVPGENYGRALAVDGERVLVGATHHSIGGAAYLFRNDAVGGWIQEQKLPSPPQQGAFGLAVALDGDVAAVTGAGSTREVYLYRFDGSSWVQEQVLSHPAGASSPFGYALALDGDVLVVGDRSGGPLGAGAVFVYRHDGSVWSLEGEFHGDGFNNQFGDVVAVSGPFFVTASNHQDPGDWKGRVHVFRFDGVQWNEHQVLVMEDAEYADQFGLDVQIDGDVLVASADRDDLAATDSGSVRVYRLIGGKWAQTERLVASGSEASLLLGIRTALSGEVVLATAYAPISSASQAMYSFDLTQPQLYAGVEHRGGSNPDVFTSESLPIVGSLWRSRVELTPETLGTLVVIGTNGPAIGGTTPFTAGELLIAPGPHPLIYVPQTVPGVHAYPIPCDPALVGKEFASQAIRAELTPSGVVNRLTNALDLTVGN